MEVARSDCFGGAKLHQHPDGQTKGHEGSDERGPTQEGFLPGGHEEQNKYAHQREEGDEIQRIGNKVHVFSSVMSNVNDEI
jgi:hypothetical protein